MGARAPAICCEASARADYFSSPDSQCTTLSDELLVVGARDVQSESRPVQRITGDVFGRSLHHPQVIVALTHLRRESVSARRTALRWRRRRRWPARSVTWPGAQSLLARSRDRSRGKARTGQLRTASRPSCVNAIDSGFGSASQRERAQRVSHASGAGIAGAPRASVSGVSWEGEDRRRHQPCDPDERPFDPRPTDVG